MAMMMMMSAASLGWRHNLQSSVRILHGGLQLKHSHERRHRSAVYGQRTATSSTCQSSHQSHPNVCLLKFLGETKQGFKFLQQSRREATPIIKLFHSAHGRKLSSLSTHAYDDSGKGNPSSSESTKKKASGGFIPNFLKFLFKAFGALLLGAILATAALPSFLSWARGRNAAISFANKRIPGTVSVSSMSIAWTRPVKVEGFSLKGTDGESVLVFAKVETKAPLWSIVLGRSGFGDCTITSPVVDLQQHPKSQLPVLALAVTPAEKLLEDTTRVRQQQKQFAKQSAPLPPAEASLAVTVKAPGGGLKVTDGKIIFPSDVGSVLGDKVIVDVGLGPWATSESEELKEVEGKREGVPLLASLWSDTVQAEAVGFFLQKSKKLKLIKPLKAEMDLTPAVAKFYLARINPLLGEIVGPAIKDEDMPDVIVNVTPRDLVLPSDHYKVNIAPMRVTLARGQVIDGVLSLFSKQQLMKGRRDLTMQTSSIEANVNMPSLVDCSRLDILIADKVHIATWGSMDWISETVQMTLAIPGKTFKDLLGMSKVPETYYLKIPVAGTLEKPQVDWKKAWVGIAELSTRQQGSKLIQGFFSVVDSNDKSRTPTPKPIGPLPWEEVVQ